MNNKLYCTTFQKYMETINNPYKNKQGSSKVVDKILKYINKSIDLKINIVDLKFG